MEEINNIKTQILKDKFLPTVLKGISIEEYDNTNMSTQKFASTSDDKKDLIHLILTINKPISKCF